MSSSSLPLNPPGCPLQPLKRQPLSPPALFASFWGHALAVNLLGRSRQRGLKPTAIYGGTLGGPFVGSILVFGQLFGTMPVAPQHFGHLPGAFRKVSSWLQKAMLGSSLPLEPPQRALQPLSSGAFCNSLGPRSPCAVPGPSARRNQKSFLMA